MDDAENTPNQLQPPPADITVQLQYVSCEEGGCQDHHPNVNRYSATIRFIEGHGKVGHIKLHTLNKAAMETTSASQMMQEGQAYDEMHLGAQIYKVGNFLENESFLENKTEQVATAQMIVFVEEVWLMEEFRGMGRGLAAVAQVLKLLQLPSKTVVVLQAGSTDSSAFDPFETEEKVTRHWARLGFEPWSDSDTAWLCLSPEDEKDETGG